MPPRSKKAGDDKPEAPKTEESTTEAPQAVDAPTAAPEETVVVERHPAHPVDEDPEEHIGEEMPDPWDDLEQTDWPSGPNQEASD